MNKINVSFFGSSEFSIPTLKHLLNSADFNVKSIITMPPAEKNRGKTISNNIVYDFALQHNFDENLIFTPKTLKNNIDIVSFLQNQNLDFIVVVAYGKIITKDIIQIPKYEILNLHPSALPKYRGAAPIERAIENGEIAIDICIMKVDVGLDTGDIAVRKEYILENNKFASEIVPDIAEIGANLMCETIKKCINNEIIFEKQTKENMIYAQKIEKNELFIDLNNSSLDAKNIYNKIRAFNNNGCCYFLFNNNRIKIIKAQFKEKNDNKNYGFDTKTGEITLNNGVIIPTIIQKEGKKPMQLCDFLNGINNR